MNANALGIKEEAFTQLVSKYNEQYDLWKDDLKTEYRTKKALEGIVSQAKIHTYSVLMNKERKEAKKNAAKIYPDGIAQWMEVLLVQTEDLKRTYLDWTSRWAGEQVQRNIERVKTYRSNPANQNMDAFRALSATEKKAYYTEQKFAHNSPVYFFNVVIFTEKALKEAEEHYLQNLVKISHRLIQKEMLPKETKIHYSRIGVNLDLTMTNDKSIVKAWTIVASGPIQRPHYRYLIK